MSSNKKYQQLDSHRSSTTVSESTLNHNDSMVKEPPAIEIKNI
jgi:hypothetical protein